MIHPVGTGFSPGSASSSGLIEAVRDAQAARGALQRGRGQTSVDGPATVTARPVLGPEAAANAGLATGRPPAGDADVQKKNNPGLVGPRPSFGKTPLEKMRSEALVTAPEKTEESDDARPDPAPVDPETSALNANSPNRPNADTPATKAEPLLRTDRPYGVIRGFEESTPILRSLDITT